MHHEADKNTMKLSVETDSEETYQVDNQSIVVSDRYIANVDGFEKKEHSWFAMSQIPTDLAIQVQYITFYVHKYPLISRSAYFGRIELSNSSCDLKLDNFPGGPETFEVILKFCYGLQINIDANNVASLRCASEFLEMTEALEDGNLITKSEAYFTFVVLSSWRDSITVLKSCENLSPWADNLQIVRRCCDSIAWRISTQTSTIGEVMNGEKWWFDDMATLRIDYFTKIVTILRAKGVNPEIIGSCIVQYGEKSLPSIEELERGEMGRNNYVGNELQSKITREQRMIIESLVSILPPEKEAVSCKFILKMLKMSFFYLASPALVSELEKRAGLVLENADVNDLLIPSHVANDQGKLLNCSEEQTMYNIEIVQRILEYSLLYEQQQETGLLAISKLLDNYLAEIARDPKLSVTKFQFLAHSLPEKARACDDGLYRAIDTYLKSHPSILDHDRKRLCKVMNCGKLSIDACAHIAQNDRLPLRTLVQVLFSEQVKIRETQGKREPEIAENSERENGCSSSTTDKEVKALRVELEKVKTQMAEMQRDYSELQQQNRKQNIKQRYSSVLTNGWRKIRKSALFHAIIDEEDTDEYQNRKNQSRRGSFGRRRSA